MARAVRKARIKEVPLSEIKDDLSPFLREAEKQEIVITRHGKPAGVLIGFESEDDWLSTGWRPIHGSCGGSKPRVTASAPDEAFLLRIRIRSNAADEDAATYARLPSAMSATRF